MGIKPLDLKKIQEIAGNTYEAIVIMAKRARQINDERKIMFNKRLEEMRALKAQQQASSEEETPKIVDDERVLKAPPEQVKIAEEFDRLPKPTDVAIEEYLEGKLTWNYEKQKQTKIKQE
ncbi:RNA polymerase Rpb6 [Candidatus Kryptobacter tengchongensis]|uniref:DNA-directed RNA polymerase subunit omega n=1 Tax=Kryptobacter tengchongensis TaxID=1643429 RepID=A0A916PE48_KRYT1|nr:DNA-directed RNA polymerase subunit omega [Candidatus Kryptobacter tengchongensis]CUS82467.1 RNA polymerase Rpb6 [Candidatus Kryptobacter tengchongensis]CUT00089.1 RNA polymerase Rpb6 [Candidatus Kryptobacter tengchongensis]CUU09504.1 RNA polymerase Rpb6 [Candidatus Kryptobacter tengchongensis]CUU10328.1 RNA polymerase Rpb6 [Candidatus Kryptobacter tengchongensis]